MKLPDIATRITDAPLDAWPGVLALTAVMLCLALAGHRLGSNLLRRLSRPYLTMGMVVRYIDRPAQCAVTVLLLQLVWWNAADTLPFINPLRRLAGLVLIGSLTWLAVRSVAAIVQGVMILNPLDTADNLRTRALHTQVHVLGRCVMGTILVIGVAAMLMTVPNVRQIGTSLLASAGVAGLVAGIAARPVLGNLIAGLQIAISQPVRIDDVVVIQGEWGRVEAITGSYIAVRIWDQRRLIVPLQWFVENAFQNWTRNSAEIIGSVFLWVDFRLPLEPVRHELVRLCESSSEWDARVQVLQVTDANERAMQLRVLVSSPDSARNFDLRCKVREGLLDFIQREFPTCLPRERAEWQGTEAFPANAAAAGAGGPHGVNPYFADAAIPATTSSASAPGTPSRHAPDLGASAAAADRLSNLPSSPKV